MVYGFILHWLGADVKVHLLNVLNGGKPRYHDDCDVCNSCPPPETRAFAQWLTRVLERFRTYVSDARIRRSPTFDEESCDVAFNITEFIDYNMPHEKLNNVAS